MKIIKQEDLDNLGGQRLEADENFSFACHAGLDCFNQCCRNLNLFLYPYDILRLKNSLGLTSGEFIETHVDLVLRDGNHFPDVLLSMADNKDKTCPFLTTEGCGVYDDRSYSCRMFPVEQGALYQGNKTAPDLIYFFRPPDFCQGSQEQQQLTPEQWLDDQDAQTHARLTRQWSAVKALFVDNPWGEAGPYGSMGKMAFMAAYNVDAFRDFVFNSSFLKRFKVKTAVQKKLRASEAELMKFGWEWIRWQVWGLKSNLLRLK